MNKANKIISLLLFTVLFLIILIVPVHAVSLYTDGDYTYADIDSYHVALYDYNGESDVLTVPYIFSDRVVSEIYAYAFENNTSITRIDFSENSNSVTAIRTKAFAGCTELAGDLVLPSSLRTLGLAAFQGCAGLETLTINTGVREIPVQCFNRCYGLREIYLAPSVETIDNLAFANCYSLETVYLPSSVTYISESAFLGDDPTLYVYNNSYAHQFAIDQNMRYILLDSPVPTEPETEEPTVPETQEPTVMETDTPTEEPTVPETVEPTQPVTEPKGYYLGDADGNGTVDSADVTWIQRHVANMNVPISEETLSHGDVDNDGVVNIVDATFIQRHLAKLYTKYPIGELIIQ